MVDREGVMRALAAQEALRGTVPDDIIDTAIAALRAQLSDRPVSDAGAALRRRQATVLFADVAGFTAFSATLDPEVVAGLMNEMWDSVDAAIGAHGGRIDKHMGDAVMGVWGIDGSREDDPERAVRAALDLIGAFERFRVSEGLDIELRIGVSTGTVLFGGVGTAGEASVTGDAANVASRLEHAAPPGSVLISHETYRHIRGVFDVQPQRLLTVKGKSTPLQTYVVERAKSRAFRVVSRGVEGVETRFIGRHVELAALQDAYAGVLSSGRSRVVGVLGEAGAGKSRLLDEFTNWLELRPETIRYLKGRSAPDLQAVPRSLLRELFAHRFEIHDDDARAMAVQKLHTGLESLTPREADVAGHWLGFDLAGSEAVADLAGSEQFGTVARAHVARHLRWLCEVAPTVMLLEDVHWADADSLDVVEHLAEVLSDVPLLVVWVARPSLFDHRPEWRSPPWYGASLVLDALDDADGRALVHEILQRAEDVPDRLVDLVVEHAGGNPFHVEELVKMLIEQGVIVVDEAQPWHVELGRLDGVAVPPTLTGVMQARLDGLDDEERVMLQHASVIGRTFWDDAVASLLGLGRPTVEASSLAPSLASARGHELIWLSDRSIFTGCVEYVFKHALLRDVTYETVLLRDRERLHAAAAAWLERRAGDRLDEHLGPIADHLVRAGNLDRAADLLQRAADRARTTGALRAAAETYESSLELRTAARTERSRPAVAARIELGDIYLTLRRNTEADDILQVAEHDARALGDDALVSKAVTGSLTLCAVCGWWERAADLLVRARPLAQALGGDALARFLIAEAIPLAIGPERDPARAYEAAVEARRLWRELGDTANELRAAVIIAGGLIAQGRLEEADEWHEAGLALARRTGDRSSETVLLSNQAMVAHLRARTGEADYASVVESYRAAWSLSEELGIPGDLGLVNLAQAQIEAGQKEDGIRGALAALRSSWRAGTTAEWCLALLVVAQHRIAEGHVGDGLALMGAVLAVDGTPTMRDEVAAIVELYGIDDETAQRGLAGGVAVDVGILVDQLLAEGSDRGS